MISTYTYGVADGYFVSNFAGKEPFTAVNLIYPLIMGLGAFGFMFGTGGSVLISKTMGEGDREKANRIFPMIVYISFGLGVVVAVAGIIFIRPIAVMLGTEDVYLEHCVTYGRILLFSLPAFMLQFEFQSFFATAEKPQFGLYVTVAAGMTNIILDAILVISLPMEYKLTGRQLLRRQANALAGFCL